MRKAYDFSGGMRGKYARRVSTASNVVTLEPDVARIFKTKEAVNDALRSQLPKTARSRKERRKG